MRLTPVPIFFHKNMDLARKYSKESSFTTHPGNIAAEACSFMTFIIVNAIKHPNNPSENVKQFLEEISQQYSKILESEIKELENNESSLQKEKSKDTKIKDSKDNVKYDSMSKVERQIYAKKLVLRLIQSNESDDSKERFFLCVFYRFIFIFIFVHCLI